MKIDGEQVAVDKKEGYDGRAWTLEGDVKSQALALSAVSHTDLISVTCTWPKSITAVIVTRKPKGSAHNWLSTIYVAHRGCAGWPVGLEG